MTTNCPIVERLLPPSAHLPVRRTAVRALLLHTTSVTLALRAARTAAIATPPPGYGYSVEQLALLEDAALRRYEQTGTNLYAGLWIGPSGTAYRLAADGRVANHAGPLDARYRTTAWRLWAKLEGRGWVKHERPAAKVWDWWDARWPGLASPAELPTGMSPNATSIGIDLMPLPDGTFPAAQHAACAALVRDLCAAHGLPRTRRHVLAHEDVDPCARGTLARGDLILGIPWDPGGRFDWRALALGAA